MSHPSLVTRNSSGSDRFRVGARRSAPRDVHGVVLGTALSSSVGSLGSSVVHGPTLRGLRARGAGSRITRSRSWSPSRRPLGATAALSLRQPSHVEPAARRLFRPGYGPAAASVLLRSAGVGAQGLRRAAVDSPGIPVIIRTSCVHCGTRLVFKPPTLSLRCDNCVMSSYSIARQVPPPVDVHWLPCPWRADGIDQWQPAGLRVSDFMYASVRVAPSNPSIVMVARAGVVLARMHVRVAQQLRAWLLLSWTELCPTSVYNELDINAFILAFVLSQPVTAWPTVDSLPTRFVGDQHLFPPCDIRYEAGRYRPASLPRDLDPGRFDPGVSAYTPVVDTGLRWQVFERLAFDHPHCGFICNSLRFGFPSLSATPTTSRWAPTARAPDVPSGEAELAAFIAKELAAGFLVDVTSDAALRGYGRLAPFFMVQKSSGGFRGIADMSWGPASVNECTTRGSLPRARMATVDQALQRIVYLKRRFPRVIIKLGKSDIDAAFRRLPLPLRDVHRFLHHFDDGRWLANLVLVMGGIVSPDEMSETLAVTVDILACIGVAAFCYVDDELFVLHDSNEGGQDGMPISIDTSLPLVATVPECIANDFEACTGLLDQLGFCRSAKKTIPPVDQLEFLGHSIDLTHGTACVTEARRAKLHDCVADVIAAQQAAPHDMQSLCGALQFISVTVPFARVFLAAMYAMAACEPTNAPMLLPPAVLDDLSWWLRTLSDPQACCVQFASCLASEPDGALTVDTGAAWDASATRVYSDASVFGVGGCFPAGREYFSRQWSVLEAESSDISHREMAGVVLAATIWGDHAVDMLFSFSDSWCSVQSLRSLSAHDCKFIELMRVAAAVQIALGVQLCPFHIPGKRNITSDQASRGLPLTGPAASWQQVHVPALLMQELSTILCSPLSRASMLTTTTQRRPWLGLLDIVRKSITLSPQVPRTTPWRYKPWMAQRRWADSCTLPVGCLPQCPTLPRTAFPTTFPPCDSVVRLSTIGSSFTPQFCVISSTASGSSPGSDAIVIQHPLLSSKLCSTTRPSNSACAQLFWWRIKRYCAVASIVRLARALYSAVWRLLMSDGFRTLNTLYSKSLASPICTTKANLFPFSVIPWLPLQEPSTALSAPCRRTLLQSQHHEYQGKHSSSSVWMDGRPMLSWTTSPKRSRSTRLAWAATLSEYHLTPFALAQHFNLPPLVLTGKPSACEAGGRLSPRPRWRRCTRA